MQITLPINGRKKTFSEQELIAILEKHFSSEAAKHETTAMVAKVPTEGKWFEVNPQSINQGLFKKERKDREQERTRNLILEAFTEVKRNPEKYGKKFKTMMPSNTWISKTAEELKQMAYELGDLNADWVEQALEWAQRICNGETWETVCNKADTANWFRLVKWKDGYARIVGGSHCSRNYNPPSGVSYLGCFSNTRLFDTVPLVVLYEK